MGKGRCEALARSEPAEQGGAVLDPLHDHVANDTFSLQATG